MKKLLIALLTVLPITTYAQTQKDEACSSFTEFSAAVMFARQSGLSFKDAKSIAIDSANGNEIEGKIKTVITEEAYRRTKYQKLENQKNAIHKFAAEMAYFCEVNYK